MRAAELGRNHTDDALIATVFAAFGAEAWLNELLWHVKTARKEVLIGRLQDLARLIGPARLEERTTGTVAKYEVIGTLLAGSSWNRGRQPFQDFDLLLDVRNAIAHQRPETLLVDVYEDASGAFSFRQEEIDKVARRLVERGVIAKPDKDVITSALALFQQPAVGRWAIATACAFIADITMYMPAGGWRSQLLLGIEDLIANAKL
jgi:hypothetical protein